MIRSYSRGGLAWENTHLDLSVWAIGGHGGPPGCCLCWRTPLRDAGWSRRCQATRLGSTPRCDLEDAISISLT